MSKKTEEKSDALNITYAIDSLEKDAEAWRPYLPIIEKAVKRLRNSIAEFEYDSVLLEVHWDGDDNKDIYIFEPVFQFKYKPTNKMAHYSVCITPEGLKDSVGIGPYIVSKIHHKFISLGIRAKDAEQE